MDRRGLSHCNVCCLFSIFVECRMYKGMMALFGLLLAPLGGNCNFKTRQTKVRMHHQSRRLLVRLLSLRQVLDGGCLGLHRGWLCSDSISGLKLSSLPFQKSNCMIHHGDSELRVCGNIGLGQSGFSTARSCSSGQPQGLEYVCGKHYNLCWLGDTLAGTKRWLNHLVCRSHHI